MATVLAGGLAVAEARLSAPDGGLKQFKVPR
jgi:hypothetical protein